MKNETVRTLALSAIVLASSMTALSSANAAGLNSASGSSGGLSWSAQSYIVGSSATNAGHGSTPYTAPMPAYSGVVGLLIDGGFVCSGTLLSDRRSVLTAGHCVSSGFTPDVSTVTAFFRDPGTGVDQQLYYPGPGYTTASTSDFFVNPNYTGQVIDQNDIAIVRLSEKAPDFVQSYGIYTTGDLTGLDFNVAGFGSTSSIGGAVGVNTANPNRLGWFRQGDNTYDFRLGDPLFGTTWSAILGEPSSQIEYSYIADFDNGLMANDASCLITQASDFGGLPGTTFCDLGLGINEVSIAGGDSGGPGFIDGKIASVNSYGLSFGPTWGDINSGLNSSYGEFNGFVPTFLHESWISSVMVAVPEPATWLQMIFGFGLLGAGMRRARRTTVRMQMALS